MAENPLAKLPLVGQVGIAVVLALLVVGGFYWLWYKDALQQQQTKENELADLQKQIRALEATANKLAEFQREVQMLEAKLEGLKRSLPPEQEMPDLMRRLQYLANQSNLAVLKFDPTTPQQKEFYQEIPIAIDIEGTYHNMGAFLDRISRIPRIVNVGGLKIKSQSKPTVNKTIAVSATATTYVYKDAPPEQTKAGARTRAAR
jgi:type IV pilus assembly protein PilO